MPDEINDPLGAVSSLKTSSGKVQIYGLETLGTQVASLPYSIKVLLESCLRNVDGFVVTEDDVRRLAAWKADEDAPVEMPFLPARVVMQDFTGVPAVVDLAAMRSAMQRLGGQAKKINPQVPCDLVIDHSVQVDHFGSLDAESLNAKLEMQRNRERYEFLKWGQQAFDNFRVVPPDTGIVHQVNLEYLAQVVAVRDGVAFPDSLVGTDSHTTMINGLGVVGWGVGGIEAEAVMLGQPIYMLTPGVVGFKLIGQLPEGATATDLVLTVTQMLREVGVVGQFVEFFGSGLDSMSLPDRATIANMAPEYGATMGFFPVDQVALDYLRMTGRDEKLIDLVERYCKQQGLWRSDDQMNFSQVIELDMTTVEPSLAGPRRPQDRIALTQMKQQWHRDLRVVFGRDSAGGAAADTDIAAQPSTQSQVATLEADEGVEVEYRSQQFHLKDGHVVIAAITSCTNTSNPSVMIGAGLLAKNAVKRGLEVMPWVKTSLAPGSRVVTEYLQKADCTESLRALGFHLVGYGCTTCIGNSGPLGEPISKAVNDGDLVVCSVLSGNRNFEGRINPDCRANYLASPPLVVAYALAGTVNIDLTREPLGEGSDGQPVFLKDIWPSQQEIRQTVQRAVNPEQFKSKYSDVSSGDEDWQKLAVSGGDLYEWDAASTYIQEPPFFVGMDTQVDPITSIRGARVLVLLGDSVTTDHISPAGEIKRDASAGEYLQSLDVRPSDFNSFGSRRGNHQVMIRGTFGNIRLRNLLAPGTEGAVTTYLPTGEPMSIYDAAVKYQEAQIPLIIIAGKEYGTGSSRDWAAKGTLLLGARAVIAASYERIHRSNLVGMGVLPLQFKDGDSFESLGLSGKETFHINLDDSLTPRADIAVRIVEDGSERTISTTCRIDTPVEIEYYRNGGILHTVLRKLVGEGTGE